MVSTLTLNPCIDRTVRLSGFEYGGMNRIESDRRDVSGKGINVSIALKGAGSAVRTGGFIYSGGSSFFLSELGKQGISFEGIEVPGQIRENLKIWNECDSVTTEINQSGAYVPMAKWEEMKAFYRSFVKGSDLAVLSGSVPRGIPSDCYRTLVEIARESGVPVILDAEKDLLVNGMGDGVFLLKPNLYEFMSAFPVVSSDALSIARRAIDEINRGACRVLCITLGKDGAIIADEGHACYAPSPSGDVKCTQGAGDSVVAGICRAYEEGLGIKDMLRYGVAFAMGTLSREGTEMCTRADYEPFLPLVEVEEII